MDEKINFGVTDQQIQNYAGNAECPEKGLSYVQNLVKQINFITNFDCKCQYKNVDFEVSP